MQSSIGPEQVCFGRFRFDLRRCRLLHDDEPIELGGRALEVLRLLALANGAVVSKDELMTRLWRGRTVEENNLHVHISALRKAMNERGGGEIAGVSGASDSEAAAGKLKPQEQVNRCWNMRNMTGRSRMSWITNWIEPWMPRWRNIRR